MRLSCSFGDFKKIMFSFIFKKKSFKNWRLLCRGTKVHPMEGDIDNSAHTVGKEECRIADLPVVLSGGDTMTPPLDRSLSVSLLSPTADNMFDTDSHKLNSAEMTKMHDLSRWWDMHNTLQTERFPNVRPCISFLGELCDKPCMDSMYFSIWKTTWFSEQLTNDNVFILHQTENPDETPIEKLRRLTRFLMKFSIYRFPEQNQNETIEQTISRILISAQKQEILIPSSNDTIDKYTLSTTRLVVVDNKVKVEEVEKKGKKKSKSRRWWNVFCCSRD
ncbi:uncharacterized protein LOC111634948 isoform X1 [Centruroides sculpturatus]|uniref:uncharacterized protein LOC111634948 isoform X1 n=1 Tax=Centruroides sculpturatus TaxID=218467 RepID=UPI000C6E6CB0|nr:uncharacterized protein LOC111634948 isoform X1 [Centruroides sculpturatus]